MKRAHEIDFTVYGDDMQFVEIGLDSGESVVAEAGAMIAAGKKGGGSKEEGSLLGNVGLGNIFGKD